MLLIAVLSLAIFTGCDSDTTESTVQNALTPGEQIFDVKNDVPFVKHEWKPFVYSEFFYNNLGDQVKMDFERMVEAILNGEEQIEVSQEFSEHVFDMIPSLFPPFYYVVDEMVYQDGVATLTYLEGRENTLEEFGKKVEEIIDACVCEGDSELMAAAAIYNYYTPRIKYDHSAVGDVYADVTGYRGIMEFEGICQSFASAYTYLCLQVGIDITTVIGISNKVETHQWCMMNIDGEYYYVDPTFDEGLSSLKYFCFTKGYRETNDNYPIAWQNIAELYRGDNFDGVNSTHFDYLRSVDCNVELERKDGQMIVHGNSMVDGTEYNFVLE